MPATDKVASGPMPGLSEPLIPDPRNDDHAIISQLTTLFHILHNGVLEMMDTEDQQSSVSEAAARYRHIVQACFNGRRIVVFSGGEAKDEEGIFNEVRAIRDGGGNGSIIGRNTFQRPREQALKMLDRIIRIYKGED